MSLTVIEHRLAGPWPLRGLLGVIDSQRGSLFHWCPVLLALGIAGYFALPFEPGAGQLAALGGAGALVLVLGWALPAELRPLVAAVGLVLAGAGLAAWRTHAVAEPRLGFRYYGPIEGRIVEIDRSISDKLRLTLDQVVLERMDPARTPARVRVSLHGPRHFEPVPGLRVMMTGHLSPPNGPVEPGGFDFQRMAWFKRLGAVGYTRSPALVAAPAEPGAPAMRLYRLRMAISAAVQRALPASTGAFAAAVTTGDRSGMGRATLDALRASNLAHLLAISGLHMGLLTGFVFAAIRLILAAIPWVALRWPVKKLAAVAGLGAGAFYYALSGGNVATERAFVMVSVMFVAVLLDRRAITLRAVAMAAMIVLALRPETLLEPGFQMSFAATTALVAAFGGLWGRAPEAVPKWARPLLALVMSSAVAGLATAPVAAAHFNRIADYGLLANVLAVPLMGLVVVPGAVLAAVLWPFGLAWVGLALMQPGIDWILGVAGFVAGLGGSVTPVVAPPTFVLGVLALGGLWLVLWQGRARLAGLPVMAAAFALWSQAERPPLLVSESGALIGVLTDKGRALNKPRGDGFTALSWLENDGDAGDQAAAASRPGIEAGRGEAVVTLGGYKVMQLSGRGVEDRLPGACAKADLVIVGKALDAPPPCAALLDARSLRQSGAMAVWPGPEGLRLIGAKDATGPRLWVQ